MTENENLEKQIADDLSAVLKEAKAMGCKEVACFRHISLQNVETVINALYEVQKYRAIGTVEECRTAVERMKPKKVTYQGEHEKCPSCGSFHVFGKHCTECGQAVDYD